MDIDEPQADQSEGGDECCSPGGGQRNWRSVLFITAIVLAGAVAAHSVLTNGGRGLLPCGGAGGSCAIDKGNGNGNGQACPKNAACAIGQDCSPDAPCPSIGTCPSQQQPCPMSSGQGEPIGCRPATTPAGPAPQAPPSTCCPEDAPPGMLQTGGSHRMLLWNRLLTEDIVGAGPD